MTNCSLQRCDTMSSATERASCMQKICPTISKCLLLTIASLTWSNARKPGWLKKTQKYNRFCTKASLSWDIFKFLNHCSVRINNKHHTHNRFTALFPGQPGWAGARRELLNFMVQRKINRGRHTKHPAGRHSIRTNQCPLPPSPNILTGQMPLLPPNQQHQSTEGN